MAGSENFYEVAQGEDIFESGNLNEVGKRCTKHPDHKEFISVQNFNKSHLLPKFQDDLVVEHFKKLADLTVLIRNNLVSETRPYGLQGSEAQGEVKKLTGTGRCCCLRRMDDIRGYKRGDQFCNCRACLQNNQEIRSWWEIRVQTAAHVVCDDIEAKHTDVVFFYDDEHSQTVTIHGPRVWHIDVEKDLCTLVCVIHDGEMEEFITKISQVYKDVKKLRLELWEKYKNEIVDEMCVIISHPHGATKQFSVGKTLKKDEDENGHVIMRYDTATCPGSSGACVRLKHFGCQWFGPPHSRCCGTDHYGNAVLM